MKVEDLNIGDEGMLFVRDGASRRISDMGGCTLATIENIRDTQSAPLKKGNKPPESRFLITFKFRNNDGKDDYAALYCHKIANFNVLPQAVELAN